MAYRGRNMVENADFIIIGGGMAGISAGARLAAGARVILLEAESHLGHHSTGRSAAIFIRNYGGSVIRALNDASLPFLENPEGVSDRSLLSHRGELVIASEEEIPVLERYLQGSAGLTPVSADQAIAMVPILRREAIAAAAYEPDAQDIDVDRMLQGFARLLRQGDGRIESDARVAEVTRRNGLWFVRSSAGDFCAPVIINAAGGWADQLATMAGIPRVGLQPLRRSAAILPAPEGHDPSRWPMFASAAERFYCKPEAGKLMVSPADEDPVDPHDVWADDMVLAEGIERFQQAVTIPVTRVERTWAGMRSFAPDRVPVVGFASGRQGDDSFFWLAGQGGYGIQTAAALAQLTADLCLGNSPKLPEETVTDLSPRRFQPG